MNPQEYGQINYDLGVFTTGGHESSQILELNSAFDRLLKGGIAHGVKYWRTVG
jgi:hypothetical protein